ncbi:MAG TPA: methyltransferase domain-containing protein [Vicinamibacterales bacterium]|nr:methyltransferase domain-containing protein [Vicinamibacterales bacterium]
MSAGRVDFSHNASTYDRRHGAVIADDAARQLAHSASLRPGSRVLDLAAGTGRVAIPLTRLGCRVVALDPARPMLDELARKSPSLSIPRILADGARLPFSSAQFDAVVIARLLYLVPEWKSLLSETCRVLVPGGRLLHEWSNGDADEEWVQIREKIRAMFEREGVRDPFHPGVRTEEDVESFLRDQGMSRTADVRLGPGQPLTVGMFLERLVDGECSYTWAVPKDVAARCLPELQTWATAHFDLTREVPLPREIVWRVYASARDPK